MTLGGGGAPSKWEQRKELKRQMYLQSTEKQMVVHVIDHNQQPKTQQCQKCLGFGHWTYQCKGQQAYAHRPSRTAILKNRALKPEFLLEAPPDEKKSVESNVGSKNTEKKKRKKRKRSPSPSSSSESSSSSDTEPSSSSSSSSESSSPSSSSSESSSPSSSSSGSSDSDE